MQNSLDMHLEKFLYIYKMPSTRKSGIWNNLGFLRRHHRVMEEDVTEWVNSFVIVEKKIPTDSNSSQGHSKDRKLRICLDPRDLNEALEREPYYTW